MNPKFRMTLIAGAVAALATSPAWAASDAVGYPVELAQAETGQPMETAPGAPGMGAEPGAEPGALPGSEPGAEPGAQPEAEPGLAAPDPAVTDNPLYSSTPADLRRMEVVDIGGEKIGKVKTVVLGPDGESAHVVISSGGFLGLGARETIVSLDELQQAEDQLQIGATKEEFEARDEYMPEQYVELEPDRPISEFSAFEPTLDRPDPAAVPAVPGTPEAPRPPQ